MQFAQTNKRPTFTGVKRAFMCSLIVLTALGALFAHTLIKERDCNGEVLLELHQKDANGRWVVIDRAKGTVHASASVLDVATGKEFESNLKWEPRSERGRRISVKQTGKGKAIIDAATGEVTVELSFDVTVDGESFPLKTKVTNQPTSSPVGDLRGNRLEIQGTKVSASVAGAQPITQRNVVDRLVTPTARPTEARNPNRSTASGAAESLIVVIRAQGAWTDK